MQSLHFWLHCFALWHISSLLFNKPKQVFTFSTLGTYPKQGLEQCQSRTTESGQALAEHQHSQEHSYVWEELKPFQRHGQTWKESTRALFQWETPPASGTAPAFTWKSQNWEHCCHIGRENEEPDFTMFPFSWTVSRDRRTSGLLNEVADLEFGLSNTNSPLNKIRSF